VVKETTFADGCTNSVSTLSAEGEAAGEDRDGSISFVGSVWTRRTPGWTDRDGASFSGVLGAVVVIDDIVRSTNRPLLQRVEDRHVGDVLVSADLQELRWRGDASNRASQEE
jgi:hypothetical protein